MTTAVGEVEFLTVRDIDAIFADNPRNITVLVVEPLRWHLSDVIGVEFGNSYGPLCGSGTEYLFRWDGSVWIPAAPKRKVSRSSPGSPSTHPRSSDPDPS